MSEKRDLVTEAFEEGGLLARLFPGYTMRPEQVELAKAVQQSIRENKVLFGEGPTGVGKSLGALVPALEVIEQENAPVVVVTSSIVLQEQYYYKDIPTLQKVFKRPLNAALIKGRANYLCSLKVNEVKFTGMSTTSGQKELLDIMEWAKVTKTGDMSELSFVPPHHVWAQVAIVEDFECQGKRCPAYDSCHYYRERKKVMTAKLIICNYHYFFTAQLVEGMLPPGIRVVVMDEGHEISAIAKDFQEQRYTVNALKNLFNAFGKVVVKLQRTQVGKETDAFILEAGLNELEGSIIRMFGELKHFYKTYKPKHPALDHWVMDREQRKNIQDLAQEHFDKLKSALEFIDNHLEIHGLPQEERSQWDYLYPPDEVQWQIAKEKLYDGMKSKQWFLKEFFGFMSDQPGKNLFFSEEEDEVAAPPLAPEDETILHWLQEYKETISMHIKPSMAAPMMSQVLDTQQQTYTPIILSATLAVNGAFKHLVEDLGVPQPHNEIIVKSPFDLNKNLLWYLPEEVPTGTTPQHWYFMAEQMAKIIRELDGRALCLFTSNKALIETTNHLRKVLPSHIKVIAQNEQPRNKLIEQLKANPNTVLMGTRSFFTGIDVQGQNLTAVLIDKLPFPIVGDPVNDYLSQRDRGFWTFTLPEMITSLKQGYGRGNRTSADKSLVACFDRRLTNPNYKSIIFNSFDFKVTATRQWDDVVAYLKSIPK